MELAAVSGRRRDVGEWLAGVDVEVGVVLCSCGIVRRLVGGRGGMERKLVVAEDGNSAAGSMR